MKRTAWVLMTALLIAILDSGNVKAGLAQTATACSYEISGVSGHSVCEDTAIEFWDWTAPATGPVTFDTRDSDHSLDLTVYTFAPLQEVAAALNEVRFTAQQGVEYTIFAQSPAQQTGTIVLNWRAASSGNGSLASVDDFGSSVAISGVSGQSERSNVGAGKESGEPDHAGDSGGASVWWTWAAPAIGMVTFDTRGSDFDTLLAVYTGDSLDSLAEMASNDDASGTRQSAVRFSAQRGRTYHIAVDGYGSESGTIVLNWRLSLSGCGNSDTPLVGGLDGSGLRETVFDAPEPGAPAYVLAGPITSVWYWTTDDAVTQSLYVSTDGSESASARTFYDADGLPWKVLDECSGNWMLIQRYDPKNVDFWFYDEDGTYQGGLAMLEARGRYYYAEIDGEPVHAGKRITGFLQPREVSWTGSYTLEVDMSVLQDLQPVPQDIAALIDGLSPDEQGRRKGMIPGWWSRFAAILSPFSVWLSPRVAVAQSEGGFLEDVLFKAGAALLAGGVVGAAPPVIIAGGAAVVVSFFAPDIAEGIRSHCPESPEMAHDFCHLAADNLADPDERGPIGIVQDAVEWASDKTERIRDKITNGMRELRDIAQDNTPSEWPQAVDEPESSRSHDTWEATETVRGTMEREGRDPVYLEGTVTPDGDFDVVDDDGEVWLDLSMGTSPITGSFEWDGVTGEVQVDPLPDDWEVSNDADATLDEQAELEAAIREAEQAAREADAILDEQAELEAAIREAEQAARELDGTHTADDDTGDGGSLPSTSTPGQTTQFSTTLVCWNYSGPYTSCTERRFTTERDAGHACEFYTRDRQGAVSCPGSYKGRPVFASCSTTTDQGRTTETRYVYFKPYEGEKLCLDPR